MTPRTSRPDTHCAEFHRNSLQLDAQSLPERLPNARRQSQAYRPARQNRQPSPPRHTAWPVRYRRSALQCRDCGDHNGNHRRTAHSGGNIHRHANAGGDQVHRLLHFARSEHRVHGRNIRLDGRMRRPRSDQPGQRDHRQRRILRRNHMHQLTRNDLPRSSGRSRNDRCTANSWHSSDHDKHADSNESAEPPPGPVVGFPTTRKHPGTMPRNTRQLISRREKVRPVLSTSKLQFRGGLDTLARL